MRRDSVIIKAKNHSKDKTLDILNRIMELSEKKLLLDQSQSQNEIQYFIQNNFEDLNKSVEEIKKDYDVKFKEVKDLGYYNVELGLKEDLAIEIESLKDQFEERRRIGIEKIKKKFNK